MSHEFLARIEKLECIYPTHLVGVSGYKFEDGAPVDFIQDKLDAFICKNAVWLPDRQRIDVGQHRQEMTVDAALYQLGQWDQSRFVNRTGTTRKLFIFIGFPAPEQGAPRGYIFARTDKSKYFILDQSYLQLTRSWGEEAGQSDRREWSEDSDD